MGPRPSSGGARAELSPIFSGPLERRHYRRFFNLLAKLDKITSRLEIRVPPLEASQSGCPLGATIANFPIGPGALVARS